MRITLKEATNVQITAAAVANPPSIVSNSGEEGIRLFEGEDRCRPGPKSNGDIPPEPGYRRRGEFNEEEDEDNDEDKNDGDEK
jgi:hypothetical protein